MLILVTGNICVGKTTFLNNVCAPVFTSFSPERDDILNSRDYYKIQLWNIHAMYACEQRALTAHAEHPDESIYVDRGLESVYIFTELYHDLHLLTDVQYNDIIRRLDSLPHTIYDKIIYMRGEPDDLYERMIKRDRHVDKWITPDILHKLQHLYDEHYMK